MAVRHLADRSRALPGRALRRAAGGRSARDDLWVGRRAGDARCDARISRDRGTRQLPPAHWRLEDQRNAERLDRRRLVHPRGHREEPAAPGGESSRTGTGRMSQPAIDCGTEGIGAAVEVMAEAPPEGFVTTGVADADRPAAFSQISSARARSTWLITQP